MKTSTAERIRQGARDQTRLEPQDTEEREILRRVAALARGEQLRLRERDQLLYLVIQRYREAADQSWAAVLLEVVAPPFMVRLGRFVCAIPGLESEDLAQQFLLEILDAAWTMPLPNHRYLERRLLLRAADSVTRWLEREVNYQGRLALLEHVLPGVQR